jgi:polyribonucleotide nucleotidyltransferase
LICGVACVQDVDFTPLRVDYFERFSAAGMTSGSYTKRDGKASDREILISRLIDRPLRPMFPETWTCDTQVRLQTLLYSSRLWHSL